MLMNDPLTIILYELQLNGEKNLFSGMYNFFSFICRACTIVEYEYELEQGK